MTIPQPSCQACHRPFHASSPQATRLRRNMFAWLNGPGKAFRKPLPLSTNYLSAYDKQGNLLRGQPDNSRNRRRNDAELDEDESDIQARELQEGLTQETVDKRADARERRRLERIELEDRGGVPAERASDLRPYPLNRQFRSQPVLSEELRRQLYELVVEQGLDVKSVSASLGVDIRRVAAVVRLESLERQWVDEVSDDFGSARLSVYDDHAFSFQ